MFTNDFKRLLVGFVMGDTLMTLRLATKSWKRVADAFIDEGVRSGELIVHNGKDIEMADSILDKCKFLRVIFLLNIKKVGEYSCWHADNLVVVDIPDGVESIGDSAFNQCHSLTAVSFPTTSTRIGDFAFYDRSSLDNVDLLHTNLRELDREAFRDCSELKSMMIPDSLQTLGDWVFIDCSKLVPFIIKTYDNDAVVAHLRSLQN
ncbi:hypothetical protein TL16_g03147 [Triparma laevis f. inornata]|uniref:Leucine-rich repeat domain-containing protein n=1 Tax=Triparma laevis f. inornata TaxID=1714386 RepID=A0A9W7DY66_9STRA|nr:hypothetical protein TL16_g03147 [Triparma laevis f. inornata]